MRIRGQDELNRSFLEWIGNLPYDATAYGKIPLHPAIQRTQELKDLISRVYPKELLLSAHHNLATFLSCSILTTRNDTVAEINEKVLNQLQGPVTEFLSADTLQDAETGDGRDLEITPELLQSFDIGSLPPAKLCLKRGAPIILLRNLYPERGLCNGTRLVVLGIGRNILECKILGGSFDGSVQLIPRINIYSNEGDLAFIIKHHQFLIYLYFTITINKS